MKQQPLFLQQQVGNPVLDQYFTPEWCAHLLVERYFPDLTPDDFVIEPAAGRGAFLKAIPDYVRAVGVEIDPEIAAQARINTGREIICGDFCSVPLPGGITAALGNPPFSACLIEKFLGRCRHLPDVARAGFLLPIYSLSARRALRIVESWSMRADIIPRQLFPNLRFPLAFVMFTRNARREMIGFAFYPEVCAIDRTGDLAREVMTAGRPGKNLWRAVLDEVMDMLGGEAHLSEIYRMIEPRRPTPNAFWKEKIRQVLQKSYYSLGEGRWRRDGTTDLA